MTHANLCKWLRLTATPPPRPVPELLQLPVAVPVEKFVAATVALSALAWWVL